MEHDWSSKSRNAITDLGMTVDGEPFLHYFTPVGRNELTWSKPTYLQTMQEVIAIFIWFPPFSINLN